jgi:hypothetical protein
MGDADVRMPVFQRVQYGFAAHLRDPERHPAPAGVEDRRMQIYRELFYNNVEGFLAGSFPVLRSLYADDAWHQLARDYFARHQAHTPFFHGIAGEFLQYLRHEHQTGPEDPPFLLELAHYEWAEIALAIDERELADVPADRQGDLMAGIPVLSPLAWNLAYRYPVQRISRDFRPDAPDAQPACIVIYRDRQDKVGFLEINAGTSRLLQLIEQYPDHSGLEQLQALAQEMQHPDPAAVIGQGHDMLAGLRRRDILLGTRI